MHRSVPHLAFVAALVLSACSGGSPDETDVASTPSSIDVAVVEQSSGTNAELPTLQPTGAPATADDAPIVPVAVDQLAGDAADLPAPTTLPIGADPAPDAPQVDVPVTTAAPREGAVNVEIDTRAPAAEVDRDTVSPDDVDDEEPARNGSGNIVTLDEAAALACAAAEGALTELDEGRSPEARIVVLHDWAAKSANGALADAAEELDVDAGIDGVVDFLTICVSGGYEL